MQNHAREPTPLTLRVIGDMNGWGRPYGLERGCADPDGGSGDYGGDYEPVQGEPRAGPRRPPRPPISLHRHRQEHGAGRMAPTRTGVAAAGETVRAPHRPIVAAYRGTQSPVGEVVMRALITRIHDVWCAVLKTCRVTPPDDATADWLERQEQQSHAETRRLRQNPLEPIYLGKRGDDDQ